MSTQCKRYSAGRKAKVSVEAIRGQKTANEIAVEHGMHPQRFLEQFRCTLIWAQNCLDNGDHQRL